MFVLTMSTLLFIVYQGECAMKATATLYGDGSSTSHGTLTFSQDNADEPVHVTGSISGLNVSSAHVR